MGALRRVAERTMGLRVVPDAPAGRMIAASGDDPATVACDTTPDATSALSFFIHYGGGSVEGGRRVTLRRIEARGSALRSFLGFCHERRALRSFRADRVEEAVDLATGEVLDCAQFHDFVMGRSGGLVETRLLAMTRLLVFLGRCDGRMVPSEWDALDRGLVRLHRSLLDDDSGADLLIAEARRLAPDRRDMLKALQSLGKTRLPARTHAELRRSVGSVIDADGVHHPSEVAWAMEIGTAVDRMPVCA